MKLVTCNHEGQTLTGMWFEDRVLDLAAAGRRMNEATDLSSMLAIVRGGEASLAALQRMEARREEFSEAWLDSGRVQLLAPIPAPVRNVFCVGRNYADHVKEGMAKAGKEMKLPEVPQFFTKATGAVNAPRAMSDWTRGSHAFWITKLSSRSSSASPAGTSRPHAPSSTYSAIASSMTSPPVICSDAMINGLRESPSTPLALWDRASSIAPPSVIRLISSYR